MLDQPIRIIVAYDEARVIGHAGRIPWNLPEDRRHFARQTAAGVVILGERTYGGLCHAALPRAPRPYGPVEPLPGRRKIVLSRAMAHWWADTRSTLAAAIDYAATLDRPIWIMGGGNVYVSALADPRVTEVVASEVPGTHPGDRHFPELGPEWQAASREERRGFTVVRYVREGVAGA